MLLDFEVSISGATIVQGSESMSKKEVKTDIIILGGGCAGLAAAAAIAQSGSKLKTIIIERHPRVGKKLLATGNGHCNLSNENLNEDEYFGSCESDAMKLFETYNTAYIKKFFKNLGLISKSDDEGRVYPHSNSASSVLDVLRITAKLADITEYCDSDILSIKSITTGFILESRDTIFFTKKLIIANGGKANGKLSSDGSGFALVKQLGIKLASLFPSLAPINVNSAVLRSLKGTRVQATVTLLADCKDLRMEYGEVQFADEALSGICVFQISRFVNEFFALHTVEGNYTKRISIKIDLFPSYDTSGVEAILIHKIKTFASLTIEDFFTGILAKRVGLAILKTCGFTDFTKQIGTFTRDDIKKIAQTLKCWQFEPNSASDFNKAQITAGGLLASEINLKTMESTRYKNLFFAGEIVDIDGSCGGYNLHWAWVSGILAGRNACSVL